MVVHMKRHQILTVTAACLLFFVQGASAWAQLSGTEDPASYGREKERLIAREERVRRSQTIQEVARVYRQMVAAYKANRILNAEEMSQQLDQLLADPILPAAFSDRIQTKHATFLQRVYGDSGRVKMDVPTDDISEEEFKKIRRAVNSQKQTDVSTDSFKDSAVDVKSPLTESVTREEQRMQALQDRLAQKEARRQERIALREERYQKKQALREKRKNERLVNTAVPLAVDSRDSQARSDKGLVADQKKLKSRQVEAPVASGDSAYKRLANLQEKALDLKKEEVDRYVRLYREQMKQEQQALQETFLVKIDNLYKDGVEFFQGNAYQFAYNVFLEVEKLHPDYKKTRNYLSQLEDYFRLHARDLDRDKVVADALDAF
jgi:hypothetical protein